MGKVTVWMYTDIDDLIYENKKIFYDTSGGSDECEDVK